MGGEGCSCAGAVGDDLIWRDRARDGEVLPGGVEIVGHALLTWAGCCALAIAAVVEGEDVDADVVQVGEGGDGVCEGSVAIGEEEDGEVGVAGGGIGGNPPAGELRGGGLIGTEVDEFVGDACDGWRVRGGAGWMQNELPLALVEEPAEGEIAAEERSNGSDGDGFDQPDGADDFRWMWLRGGAFVLSWSGAGHRGFCIDCSIQVGLRRRW